MICKEYHLTTIQLNALKTFATNYGRTWKKDLQGQWMRGTANYILQDLRNTFGPSWLAKFKF